jgi:hypothetical protein
MSKGEASAAKACQLSKEPSREASLMKWNSTKTETLLLSFFDAVNVAVSNQVGGKQEVEKEASAHATRAPETRVAMPTANNCQQLPTATNNCQQPSAVAGMMLRAGTEHVVTEGVAHVQKVLMQGGLGRLHHEGYTGQGSGQGACEACFTAHLRDQQLQMQIREQQQELIQEPQQEVQQARLQDTIVASESAMTTISPSNDKVCPQAQGMLKVVQHDDGPHYAALHHEGEKRLKDANRHLVVRESGKPR